MSGSRSQSILVINGMTSDTNTQAQLQAVQTPGTHVGVSSISFFNIVYNGAMLSFYPDVPFVADAGLYALINATPSVASLVTWVD